MTEGDFYAHFQRDRPTGLGVRLTAALSRRVFESAGIKAGDRVLEIGPGRGAFAELCLERRTEFTAIEPNPELAASLERRGVAVFRAKVPPLPALPTKYDVTVMIHVLEHMDGLTEALQVTQQIRDHLEPGGRLVVCSPDYLNMRHYFFDCDFSHNYVTTRRRLAQLLLSAGYEDVRSRYLSGPWLGPWSLLPAAVAAHLPFGLAHAWCPQSRLCLKLYKLQLTFCRQVMMIAENRA